jgi:polypeptide N-acetylgalactosaminyltransferase
MRASYKPFFLGIIFTSITWCVVLYLYVSLSPINSSTTMKHHSVPFIVTVKEGKPSTVPIVINNYLGEFDQDAHSKKLVPHFKAKMNKSASNNLEANLGLVRNSEDQKIREDGYSKHAFNVLVSSRLDYHREIPDSRHKM